MSERVNGWDASAITNMVGTASTGLSNIIGSFDWLRKTPETVNYYVDDDKSSDDYSSIIMIIAILVVVALLVYLIFKK